MPKLVPTEIGKTAVQREDQPFTLCADIGNSEIAVGGFYGSDLVFHVRFKSDPGTTTDEYHALLRWLLADHGFSGVKIGRGVVSSVVPTLTRPFTALFEDCFKVRPIVVGPGIRTGLALQVHDPGGVGADRVVNSLAVKHLFGTPAIAIDFGTATSFDFVNEKGGFEGGIIAPGIASGLEALVRSTAKLPRVELAWPSSVIGKNTVSAMQSGIVRGYVAMVDGLIEMILKEVGPVKHVVATGGLGALVAAHSKSIQRYEPYLTLKGMQILADINDSEKSKG